MSGLEPLMVAAAIGGTALSATSKVMQGREQAKAALFEQQEYQIQEQLQRTAAKQDEAARRDELTSNLETVQAIRSGRGVGLSSPTGMATLEAITDKAESDITISRFNYLQKADLAGRTAEMAGSKAETSLLAGYLGAGADIGSAGFKLGSIYARPR